MVCFSLEPITVGYEFTEYTTSEGDGYIKLCGVVTSHHDGAPKPFIIAATTEDGVASMLLHVI